MFDEPQYIRDENNKVVKVAMVVLLALTILVLGANYEFYRVK